ncbi:AraC family transcriptional regulator [Cohnella endophytica]|uniref:AraC family transcriptional regulator n=1 Tax=Cohnella endophytica TaxID=2419778 RepID=A0A494XLL8_9BACL|nr:AraC family transcriptional regulator [Cohnella endophytica]RKP51590.1 AraC family transcriptional regulator [Cohnella endophytica]
MDDSIRSGQKNSVTEQFIPDLRVSHHISLMHVREVNSDWEYPSHEHKQYEINYVHSGCQIISINGKTYRQQAGDFALIRPGDIHSSTVETPEGMTYFCMHFEIDDRPLMHLLRSTRLALFSGDRPDGAVFKSILERMLNWVVSEERYDMAVRANIQADFFQIIAQLCLSLSASMDNRDEKKLKHWEYIHQIESLIQAIAKQPIYHGHPDKDRLLIGQIAKQIGISESHCNRLFKNAFGISPRQYLSRIVQEEAMRLLRDTTLNVDHISNLLGYVDIAHFSRQFKRWTGESPRSYRASQRESLESMR